MCLHRDVYFQFLQESCATLPHNPAMVRPLVSLHALLEHLVWFQAVPRPPCSWDSRCSLPVMYPIIRPVIPSVTPAEKPQTTVYIGKIAPSVENDLIMMFPPSVIVDLSRVGNVLKILLMALLEVLDFVNLNLLKGFSRALRLAD
ncbi:hypothetical protein NC652_024401 [Populus alba x Populus x berolinensis]|nr:hypothetical protein NC652_024401 [Populus alba x Populus x berolinensis]